MPVHTPSPEEAALAAFKATLALAVDDHARKVLLERTTPALRHALATDLWWRGMTPGEQLRRYMELIEG
jgi:hypothetical protein